MADPEGAQCMEPLLERMPSKIVPELSVYNSRSGSSVQSGRRKKLCPDQWGCKSLPPLNVQTKAFTESDFVMEVWC